jgi:hypothetical protein
MTAPLWLIAWRPFLCYFYALKCGLDDLFRMTEAAVTLPFHAAVYAPPGIDDCDPWLLIIWENAQMTAVPYQTEAEALAHMALKRLEFARAEANRAKLNLDSVA